MQKIIKVSDLEPGMYLFKICGSWVDYSFWKEEFILTLDHINLLKKREIAEVVVDFSKSQIHSSDDIFADFYLTSDKQHNTSSLVKRNVSKTSFSTEIIEAKTIIKNAKVVVQNIFTQARTGQHINTEEINQLAHDIGDSILRHPDALVSLVTMKNKDNYTYMHSIAVCALMMLLSKKLGHNEEQRQQAGIAGLLHDIGKIFIPVELINKPGALTDEEYILVKKHSRQGYDLLKTFHNLSDDVLNVCLHHHEKYDGTGYPSQLKGENIPLISRMATICDTYDAITSDRSYKKAWAPTFAIKQMSGWTGHFDPTIFRAFVSTLGIYPVGSIVKLNNGQIGVVVQKCETNLLTPKVLTFFSSKNNLRIPPAVIDLSQHSITEKIDSYDTSFKLEDIQDIFNYEM